MEGQEKPIKSIGSSEAEQKKNLPNPTSDVEEKSSGKIAKVEHKPEEKSSESGAKKEGQYNGLGRRFDDIEKDQILDRYILTGQLPTDVTARSLYDMKHHPRLEVRRLYLENAGLIKKAARGAQTSKAGKTGKHGNNVLPYRRRQVQR